MPLKQYGKRRLPLVRSPSSFARGRGSGKGVAKKAKQQLAVGTIIRSRAGQVADVPQERARRQTWHGRTLAKGRLLYCVRPEGRSLGFFGLASGIPCRDII